jgi:DNA-binding response OmpR family regulator
MWKREGCAILKDKKILAVDDCPQLRNLISSIFCSAGAKVITAKSGEEGVLMALRETPDFITMDNDMLAISGVDACKILKESPEVKKIPVLMVSSDYSIFNALLEGKLIDDYLPKPFTITDLLGKAVKILEYREGVLIADVSAFRVDLSEA